MSRRGPARSPGGCSDFKGILQSDDGYSGYTAVGRRDGTLTTVAEIETLLPWNVARPATQSVAA